MADMYSIMKRWTLLRLWKAWCFCNLPITMPIKISAGKIPVLQESRILYEESFYQYFNIKMIGPETFSEVKNSHVLVDNLSLSWSLSYE